MKPKHEARFLPLGAGGAGDTAAQPPGVLGFRFGRAYPHREAVATGRPQHTTGTKTAAQHARSRPCGPARGARDGGAREGAAGADRSCVAELSIVQGRLQGRCAAAASLVLPDSSGVRTDSNHEVHSHASFVCAAQTGRVVRSGGRNRGGSSSCSSGDGGLERNGRCAPHRVPRDSSQRRFRGRQAPVLCPAIEPQEWRQPRMQDTGSGGGADALCLHAVSRVACRKGHAGKCVPCATAAL